MNRSILRNLLAALLSLTVTVITTQTIVHAAPRPYTANAPALVQPQSDPSSHLARCAGRGDALC